MQKLTFLYSKRVTTYDTRTTNKPNTSHIGNARTDEERCEPCSIY